MQRAHEQSALTNNSSFRQKGNIIPLLVLILLATAVRLAGLESRPLFNDELSALYRLQGIETFNDLIDSGVMPDFHPAGVQVALYLWTSLAGDSPFMVRFPFALAGILGVALCFLLAQRWVGRTSAWFAAVALALLQFPVMYGQLARPYSTGVLWILAAAWCWDILLEITQPASRQKRRMAAVGLAVTFALAMYNHYFSFVMVGLMGITGLFMVKRRDLMLYLLAGAGAVLLFMPHLPVTLEQVSRGGLSSWLPPPDNTWFTEHLLHLFNGSVWITTLCLVPLGLWVTQLRNPGLRPKWFLLIWYFVPMLFAFAYSRWVNPILQHSILLFAFPFLLMFVFSGFRSLKSWPVKIAAGVFPMLLTAHLISGTGYYQKVPYADMKKTGEWICQASEQNPSFAWAADLNNPWYLHHYYLNTPCTPDSALFYLFDDQMLLPRLHAILDTLSADVFAYAWLRPADPMVVSVIRNHYPYLLDWRPDHPYSEYFLFGKTPEATSRKINTPDTLELSSKPLTIYPLSTEPMDEYTLLFEGVLPSGLSPGRETLIHITLHTDTTLLPEGMVLVITTASPKGISKSWNGINLKEAYNGRNQCFYTIALPGNLHAGDVLSVYLWNREKEVFTTHKHRVVLVNSSTSSSKITHNGFANE
jgi:hypothetical protein